MKNLKSFCFITLLFLGIIASFVLAENSQNYQKNNKVNDKVIAAAKYECPYLIWTRASGASTYTAINDGADIACNQAARHGKHGRCYLSCEGSYQKGDKCTFVQAVENYTWEDPFTADTKVNSYCRLVGGGSDVPTQTNGCKIEITPPTSTEEWAIYDNNKIVDSGYTSRVYTCKSSNCKVVYSGVGQGFLGLAGDGNCSTGVRTTGTTISCTSSGIKTKACYKSVTTTKTTTTTTTKKPSTKYSVTLYPNSGTIKLSSPYNGITSTNKTLTMQNLTTFNFANASASRSGYIFKGWGLSSTCTGGSTSGTITLTSNQAYYACFVKGTSKKYTFDFYVVNDGGTLSGGTSGWEYGVEGRYQYLETTDKESVTVNFPTSGTKSGYIFGGVYTGKNCTGSKVTNFTANPSNTTGTYYACWLPNSILYKLNIMVRGNGNETLNTNGFTKVDFNLYSFSATSSNSSYKINLPTSGTVDGKYAVVKGYSETASCSANLFNSTYTLNSTSAKYDASLKKGVVEKTIYACLEESSGGGTGNTNPPTTNKPTTNTTAPTTTAPVIVEPKPTDKNINVNAYYWAKGKEYQGNSISCGDKLYITTCTNDTNSVCNVTKINGANVTTTTQIYKDNITSNESNTNCPKIVRYVSENTSSFTNADLTSGKKSISCGTEVTFNKSLDNACNSLSCEGYVNGNKVYIARNKLLNDKPVCTSTQGSTCVSSSPVTNLKDSTTIKLCKNDATEETLQKIVSCAPDYDKEYNMFNDTCSTNSGNDCYKEYKFTCSYLKRPSVSASAGQLGSDGLGTITIKAKDNGSFGLKGYYISNGTSPAQNSNWTKFADTGYTAYEKRSAGTYFVWVVNNKNRISYPIMAKVYDADLSTTLSKFSITDSNGNDVTAKPIENNTTAYNDVVIDSGYTLLSNKLRQDSILAGFDSLTTAYEVNVTSNKIALYATLTSKDASYIPGYEPRTINLDYGRNVALIKIVNKKGKERTYTFIINRIDDRDGSNLLSDITLSKGKIEFDSYTPSYDVNVPKNTKKVSINGTLASNKAAFIKGYEPREIELTEDIQSAVLKVRSESGSIRSYVVTFIKSGVEDEDILTSTYLSSLSVPGTQLGFDKKVYDYTISIPYDVDKIPIYAFAESGNGVVEISNNAGLKVGNNLIEITVKNGNKTRIYSLHVIRKESGLNISNSTRLSLLSIKNYDIAFNPDLHDYVVKIKREKSLLITASPESNRADVYMYGNNDLTGFSTVRVKVIAENGLTGVYSVDIQKDPYNKALETIAVIGGGLLFTTSVIIIVLRKKHKKVKEYLEG